MSLAQFRPRSVPELLDASIQLARRHYAPLLLLSAVVAIPGLVFSIVTAWLEPAPDRTPPSLGAAVVIFPIAVVAMLWTFVGMGALVAAAASAYTTGASADPATAIRQALARAGALTGGLLLAYLRAFLGVLLVILAAAFVLGIMATTVGQNSLIAIVATAVLTVGAILCGAVILARYAAVPAIIMLEGAGARASLRRSRELADGSVQRLTLLLVVTGVVLVALSLTIYAVVAYTVPSPTLASAASSLVTLTLYPVFACVLALLYFDLRIRKEGYDIELMARQLGDAVTDPVPAPGHSPV